MHHYGFTVRAEHSFSYPYFLKLDLAIQKKQLSATLPFRISAIHMEGGIGMQYVQLMSTAHPLHVPSTGKDSIHFNSKYFIRPST